MLDIRYLNNLILRFFSIIYGFDIVEKSTLRVLKVVVLRLGLEQSYVMKAFEFEISCNIVIIKIIKNIIIFLF